MNHESNVLNTLRVSTNRTTIDQSSQKHNDSHQRVETEIEEYYKNRIASSMMRMIVISCMLEGKQIMLGVVDLRGRLWTSLDGEEELMSEVSVVELITRLLSRGLSRSIHITARRQLNIYYVGK